MGLIAVMPLALVGNILLGAAENRTGSEKALYLAGGVLFGLLPLVVLVVYFIKRRNRVVQIEPGMLPTKPDGKWQLVRLRVRLRDKVGYWDLGWLNITSSTVEFRGRLCDFATTASDWEWVTMFDGVPSIRIAKKGKVASYSVRFVPLSLREGRATSDKVARSKLLEALQRVYPSGRPSCLPPIELPKVEPAPLRKLVLVAVGGALEGLLLVTIAYVVNRPHPLDPVATLVMFIVTPPFLGGLGVLLMLSPQFAYRSRQKEIGKLVRKA